MTYGFLDIASTPGVMAAQAVNGSADHWRNFTGDRAFDRFGQAEADFISQRDSFYLATISETGWPYVQHRGGAPGFLRVLDDQTLGCADFRGNRQYITVGNLAASDRVALFLMDYPKSRRLKLFAKAEIKDVSRDPGLASRLTLPGYKAKIERGLVFHLVAFDWNCPQHINPRFAEAEFAESLAPVKERLAALEDENAALREKLASLGAR